MKHTNTPLVQGIQKFSRENAQAVRPLMEKLAREGQAPTELFITCADSRIVPSLLTASGPGELFIVRNVGNLVPPPEVVQNGGDTSVSAAIDYCLNVLSIDRIVVCGHSSCGAMNALLKGGEPTNPATPLGGWLSHGNKSLETFRAGAAMDGAKNDGDALSQINVLQQLETLRSFPDVKKREDDGSLALIGLFLDIETASVHIYDDEQNRFVAVA